MDRTEICDAKTHAAPKVCPSDAEPRSIVSDRDKPQREGGERTEAKETGTPRESEREREAE